MQGWRFVVAELSESNGVLDHLNDLIKDIGPPLSHEAGIWPENDLPPAVINILQVAKNTLHDRVVFTAHSQAFCDLISTVVGHMITGCVPRQAVPESHEDRFWTLISRRCHPDGPARFKTFKPAKQG